MTGNARERLLTLLSVLLSDTDENNTLTLPELRRKLGQHGISADRRALYADIEALSNAGWEVLREETGKRGYFLAGRSFDDAELTMLISIVHTCQFLPQYQSYRLENKLLKLGTPTLRRDMVNRHRPLSFDQKGAEANVLYTVDLLSRAISDKCPVSFLPFTLDWHKRRVLADERELMLPIFLVWSAEHYWLVGMYPDESLRHYRVDRIAELKRRPELKPQEDVPYFETERRENLARRYARFTFGPEGGAPVTISLRCRKEAADLVFEYFGANVPVYAVDDTHFNIDADVSLNAGLYGWLISNGDSVRLLGPEAALRGLRQLLSERSEQYNSY